MGFWDKSLRICKCLCEHDQQGVRRIAPQTGFSKSSVRRSLCQGRVRRGGNRYHLLHTKRLTGPSFCAASFCDDSTNGDRKSRQDWRYF